MNQEKERLLARKARIESRLAAIEETEAKKREKEDQRRAELAGQAVLKHAKKDKAFAARLHEILDAGIARSGDRALFDLPPKSRGDTGTVTPQSAAAAGEDVSAQPVAVSGSSSSP